MGKVRQIIKNMYYMNSAKYNASLSNILKNLISPLHLPSFWRWGEMNKARQTIRKTYYANFVKYNVRLSNILKNLIFSLTLSSLGSGVK